MKTHSDGTLCLVEETSSSAPHAAAADPGDEESARQVRIAARLAICLMAEPSLSREERNEMSQTAAYCIDALGGEPGLALAAARQLPWLTDLPHAVSRIDFRTRRLNEPDRRRAAQFVREAAAVAFANGHDESLYRLVHDMLFWPPPPLPVPGKWMRRVFLAKALSIRASRARIALRPQLAARLGRDGRLDRLAMLLNRWVRQHGAGSEWIPEVLRHIPEVLASRKLRSPGRAALFEAWPQLVDLVEEPE